MKHSFLLIAAAILLTAVSCKDSSKINPDNTTSDTFLGTWIIESNGTLNYNTADSSKTIPILMVDTMVITASDKSGYCHVKCGKLDADAAVTSNGLEIPDFVIEKNDTGTYVNYSYNLTLKNEPAKVSLTILSWKSTVSGEISGGVFGVGASYAATGSLTNRGILKK